MTTKKQRIAEYNEQYPEHNITGIKKMTDGEVYSRGVYGDKSLYELYKNPSDVKVATYKKIMDTYSPRHILAVAGSSMEYSVLLKADNGYILHITKLNNYLVEIV